MRDTAALTLRSGHEYYFVNLPAAPFVDTSTESVLEEVLDGVTAVISDARRDFSFLFGARAVRECEMENMAEWISRRRGE